MKGPALSDGFTISVLFQVAWIPPGNVKIARLPGRQDGKEMSCIESSSSLDEEPCAMRMRRESMLSMIERTQAFQNDDCFIDHSV